MKKLVFALVLSALVHPLAPAAAENSPAPAVNPCVAGLMGYTLEQILPEPKWIVGNGFSQRGFLGTQPARDKGVEASATAQGVFHWGVSLAVAKTIEDARAHDASHKFKNLGKFPYLITPVDVSDFTKDTPLEIVRERFKKILADPNTRVVEFEDAEKPNGKKIPAEKYAELKLEDLRRLGVEDEVIWFVLDERGPRFHFYGWAFPRQVGVVEFEDLFSRNKEGAIADRDIRTMFRNTIDFIEKDGGTITFSSSQSPATRVNFNEALDAARDQWRKGPDGATMVQNSRFKIKPSEYLAALERFDAGTAFSVEARDKNGVLLAGEILFREGNVITPNTIFHRVPGRPWASDTWAASPEKYPDTSPNYAYLAKALSIAEAIRFRNLGIPFIDVGMVSPLTEEEGGKMIQRDRFDKMVAELNARPRVDLQLDKPFSLSELPFPRADLKTWIPDKQEPPQAKPKVERQLRPARASGS